jgi:hypothetical protein
MKKKTSLQKKSSLIKKEDFKNISEKEFDSVMKTILSAPQQVKKSLKKGEKNE